MPVGRHVTCIIGSKYEWKDQTTTQLIKNLSSNYLGFCIIDYSFQCALHTLDHVQCNASFIFINLNLPARGTAARIIITQKYKESLRFLKENQLNHFNLYLQTTRVNKRPKSVELPEINKDYTKEGNERQVKRTFFQSFIPYSFQSKDNS